MGNHPLLPCRSDLPNTHPTSVTSITSTSSPISNCDSEDACGTYENFARTRMRRGGGWGVFDILFRHRQTMWFAQTVSRGLQMRAQHQRLDAVDIFYVGSRRMMLRHEKSGSMRRNASNVGWTLMKRNSRHVSGPIVCARESQPVPKRNATMPVLNSGQRASRALNKLGNLEFSDQVASQGSPPFPALPHSGECKGRADWMRDR